ncbi:hypothetical protein [Halorussus caseinilyticus]|uniref:Uncharacterized protein n=1 Tax=Halorussus caseinilyticus TaxID=3034025 RepID=A0ABD5WPH8_9EURY|nr:hypothetical protein [Halorussus sp. DT72]
MANPHREQRRREAANEDRLHESGETRRGDHPADERHTNEYGDAADRDRERRARQLRHDETGHGHANRWGSNRTTETETTHSDTESPNAGSQRGSHREDGISGRITGQRGETTRHSDPSDSSFREGTGGEREHRHGGREGTSERDRRYGSRRGHGSERDTERRHSSR